MRIRAQGKWIGAAAALRLGAMVVLYAAVFVAYFVGMAVLVRLAPEE